ncbi:MAG: exodeoxyribonuclease V subunit gamma [Verrucomicrobiae bacterium]|nr:exodeoxyribonuclease V subunit gamma [Verrucomicrobiae bacterium]
MQVLMQNLYLYTSNRLELLADKLAELWRKPLRTPFTPGVIVVQSLGMARWLKFELAARLGICANFVFPFPKAFARGLFKAVHPELPEQTLFDREVMTWKLMALLPELARQKGFDDVRHFLGRDHDQRKLFQLAAAIANLFDQYHVFRPQLIADWAKEKDSHWQARLWREIANGTPPIHPPALRAAFFEAIQAGRLKPDQLPERVAVFGISALPPFYLELLAALAALSELHLFLLQPCKHYWGDILTRREADRLLKAAGRDAGAAAELHLETGNRLLASMGRLGRSFLNLVIDAGDWQHHEQFVDPGEDTLLHAIQSDILNLRDRASQIADAQLQTQDYARATRLKINPDDDSVQVHSCHSPLREVEVLYDHLLHWFERDPTLAPRDVVVMAPDIETYAPFVHAVFDAPEDESLRIPYCVADRAPARQSTVANAFMQLLELATGRFRASEVLGLLETRPVHEKFGLTEPELDTVRRWVRSTNIRWGIDAAHRETLGLPAYPEHTWRHGLDRLMLGYAMSSGGGRTFAGILPFDGIEGDAADTLGKLAAFADRLFAAATELGHPHTMSQWEQLLLGLLDTFFLDTEDSHAELLTVRAAVRGLAQCAALAGFDGPVELPVVIEALGRELAEDKHGAGFITGGVTFCALKPMRSIPFRVICLLGMNDTAFPRTDRQLAFDLMAQDPRPGDRSVREDDRYLFLETLISARERLYISYVGQSQRDNSELQPSVLVSELLDYIARGFELPGKDIINDHVLRKHRLQAFSPAYFDGSDPRLFSYSAANCAAGQQAQRDRAAPRVFISSPLPEPEPEWRALTLDDLAEFFSNPARFIVTRRLGARLPIDEEPPPDEDAFALGPLDAYAVKQHLVEAAVEGKSPDTQYTIFKAAGLLPPAEAGRVSWHDTARAAQQVAEKLAPYVQGGFRQPVHVDIRLGEFRLTGRLSRLTGAGRLVGFRCAQVKAKDMLRHWVQHLALNVQRPDACACESILLGTDVLQEYKRVDAAEAVLLELLDLYWAGLRQPLRFFPESARAFVRAELAQAASSRSKKAPIEVARDTWNLGFGGRSHDGEKEDAYFDLCFGAEPDPLNAEFERVARTVFRPIFGHMQQTEL